MQCLFRDLRIGYCQLDTNLRYIYIDDWLAEINGIPAEEHLGRTISELIPEVAAGAGLGGASVEGEIIDSVTGEQLAASIRWGGGSRFGKAALTKTGDARAILSRWADGLRDDFDKMHSVTGD